MRRSGMSKTQTWIQRNFGGCFELGFRNRLLAKKVYRTPSAGPRRVALKTKRIHLGAHLGLEFRHMGFVADHALAALVRAMEHGLQLGLVTLGTQVSTRRNQGDGRLILSGDDVVALRAAHPYRGMDEPALSLLRMTGQAGPRLDVPWLDVGVLELLLGANSKRGSETDA